jgi:hypothetical protein
MTVRINKPAINLREKLSELDKPSGLTGEELLRSDTPSEARDALNLEQHLFEEFESTGIDDNATSTKVTVSDSGVDVTGTVTADGLTVDGNSYVGSGNYFTDTTSGYFFGGNGSYANGIFGYGTNNCRISTDSKSRLTIDSGGDIQFYEDTGTTPKLTWSSSAESLGIGVTDPSSTLDIADSFGAINLESSTGTNQVQVKVLNTGGSAFFGRENSAGSWFGTGEAYATTLRSDGAYPMIFRVNGENRLVLDDGGNVGIGTASASSQLHIDGSSNGTLRVDTTASGYLDLSMYSNGAFIGTSSATQPLRLGTNGSERMRIDSSGNLLVGTTAFPTDDNTAMWFGVSGSSGQTRINVNNDSALHLKRATSDGDMLVFRRDSATPVGSIGTKVSSTYIGTGNVGLLFWNAQNAVTPYDTGNTVSNGVIDLGVPNYKFKDLYLSGGVYLGGTGSANKLDDYEEGTWTPEVKAGGSALYSSYSRQTGKYTKIGSTVILRCRIRGGTKTSATGSVVISGVPFAQSFTGYSYASTSMTTQSVSNGINPTAVIVDSDLSVTLIKNNTSFTTGDYYINSDFTDTSIFDFTLVYQTNA